MIVVAVLLLGGGDDDEPSGAEPGAADAAEGGASAAGAPGALAGDPVAVEGMPVAIAHGKGIWVADRSGSVTQVDPESFETIGDPIAVDGSAGGHRGRRPAPRGLGLRRRRRATP